VLRALTGRGGLSLGHGALCPYWSVGGSVVGARCSVPLLLGLGSYRWGTVLRALTGRLEGLSLGTVLRALTGRLEGLSLGHGAPCPYCFVPLLLRAPADGRHSLY
jgi:hypothetical protein